MTAFCLLDIPKVVQQSEAAHGLLSLENHAKDFICAFGVSLIIVLLALVVFPLVGYK